MKRILAFGDSLTWGHRPEDGQRHAREYLWPEVLAAGISAEVISEGLGGRTTAFDDDTGPCCRNGTKVLPILLQSHTPLDLVIIMLGTNDLKPTVCGLAEGPVAGMKRLVQMVRHHDYAGTGPVPQVMIVAPPPCVAGPDGRTGSGRDLAETRRLAPMYRDLAAELGCAFFNAGTVAEASSIDGVHLDGPNTAAIGTALVAPVKAALV